jgi:hypothetical protein
MNEVKSTTSYHQYILNKIKEKEESLVKEYYVSIPFNGCSDHFVHASSESEAIRIAKDQFENKELKDLNLEFNSMGEGDIYVEKVHLLDEEHKAIQ